MEVSEATAELLTERCTLGLRNDARLKARRRYPLPKVPATRTPQLDGFIKSEVPMATRNADKELARLQSLVLDSLASLTHLLEAEQRGGPPTWEEAKKAVVAATELVSNASAKITHLRREKVTTDLNKVLLPVAKEATNFQSAPPSLFGTEFAKKAKDHVDQVKAMRASLPTKPDTRSPFRGGPEASSESSEAATTGKADTNSSRGEELGAATGPSTRGTGSQNFPRTNAPISCHFTTISFDKHYKSTKGLGRGPLKSSKGGCRKAPIPPSKLGKGHQGQVGPRYGKGLPNRIHKRPLPEDETAPTTIRGGAHGANEGGADRATAKRGGHADRTGQGRFLLNPVPSAEKRRQTTPRNKPQSAKSVRSDVPLQDGRLADAKGPDKARRLAGKGGSKGCLFRNYRSKPQDVSTVCSGQPDLPVQLSSLWPGSSTMGLHQDPQASSGYAAPDGVRLVCYIDDILLLAETQTVAEEQVKGLQYLLECLGFIVHSDKSIMTPGQVMECSWE